jgi:hypothetical protein
MEDDLPQPQFQPATPPAGWWKSPASLATDPVFLRVPDTDRLAAIGAYTASVGWTITHSSEQGWVPAAALLYGQVCPAPQDQMARAIEGLVSAGLFLPTDVDGMGGYVVAGAKKAVEERFARQKSAAGAGHQSQKQRSEADESVKRYPPSKKRIDANAPVDWSKVSSEL